MSYLNERRHTKHDLAFRSDDIRHERFRCGDGGGRSRLEDGHDQARHTLPIEVLVKPQIGKWR